MACQHYETYQQKYRKGHVFSNPRTFLIKHLICYNFLRISRIPETTSQYPVSQEIFPQISRIPKTPNGASHIKTVEMKRSIIINVSSLISLRYAIRTNIKTVSLRSFHGIQDRHFTTNM